MMTIRPHLNHHPCNSSNNNNNNKYFYKYNNKKFCYKYYYQCHSCHAVCVDTCDTHACNSCNLLAVRVLPREESWHARVNDMHTTKTHRQAYCCHRNRTDARSIRVTSPFC
eukprot:5883943-Amphidinium_carterae.1